MSADAYNDKNGDAYVNLDAHDTDVGSINNVTANVPLQLRTGRNGANHAQLGHCRNLITVALTWGIADFLGITVAGGVSGGHLNPTVTVAVAALGMLPWKKVPFYLLAQLLASYIAALVVYILYRPMLSIVDPERTSTNAIFATYPLANVGNFTCFLTEFFAAAVLVVGFLAVQDQHNRPIGRQAVPAAIGVLASAIAMAFGMNTGLAINAARDLGPRLLMWTVGFGSRVFSLNHYYFWIPLVAPILGGAVGGIAYEGMVGYHHPTRSHGPYPEFRY
ncbi:Major intrinsic protein [Phytophthora infestans]|uniref:Major intrinsic protein n=1 Tax=Phytophthora infestans TaxID=4787 RepID=A0A833T1E5_PHYIN|nr:Major intrinsic protein [Phytophthora infestans]KAF4147677.1 Major intrinsic protein [Phytophthora infestans]